VKAAPAKAAKKAVRKTAAKKPQNAVVKAPEQAVAELAAQVRGRNFGGSQKVHHDLGIAFEGYQRFRQEPPALGRSVFGRASLSG
jgi:hypothetical protein